MPSTTLKTPLKKGRTRGKNYRAIHKRAQTLGLTRRKNPCGSIQSEEQRCTRISNRMGE